VITWSQSSALSTQGLLLKAGQSRMAHSASTHMLTSVPGMAGVDAEGKQHK